MDALEARGYGCAALLVDTIFSSDGVFADPPGFLAQTQRVHGALNVGGEEFRQRLAR
jgi:4-aminobutyrate aminotransferase-like enzyme